jgi:hypothetical protein
MKPQTMPGEESGAGRVIAPDLYRANGSLPIPKSYHARGCGLNRVRGARGCKKLRRADEGAVLWKSIQYLAGFLQITCHAVIAGTFMLLNFDA